ncbi:MAG: IclR family transcriptional regulator [Actinomycetota bacterium]
MSRNRLSSVARAARLLKLFTTKTPSWGVSELARATGQSTSTVHRLAATLADEGLLEQDAETGRYRLGLALFDMAAAVPTHRSLHEAVMMPMTELRHRSGETVQVGVLDGRQVVYVERLDGPNTLRFFVELGRRNHAHCTGSGKVLLANLAPARRAQLLRGWELPELTSHTITSTDDLVRELTSVRRRGYAENRHESEIGVCSIAAPIRDSTDSCVAAMSVAGPIERIDGQRDALVDAVTYFARLASRQLGAQH